jgi:hypothetical protein
MVATRERETGFEPATSCLEDGTIPIYLATTVLLGAPLLRKVYEHRAVQASMNDNERWPADYKTDYGFEDCRRRIGCRELRTTDHIRNSRVMVKEVIVERWDLPLVPNEPVARGAWISPEGELFSCAACEHTTLALAIVEQRYGLVNTYDPHRLLDEHGWVHVWTWGSWASWNGQLTQAQLDTLWDLSEVGGVFGAAIVKGIQHATEVPPDIGEILEPGLHDIVDLNAV